MSYFLSVDSVFFTVLEYPMSYIEFFGTLLYLWSVWLIARRRMLTWPVGIVSVLLYMALFYQIRLYSDALEQIYYLVASLYGWWYWSRTSRPREAIADIGFSPGRAILGWMAVAAGLSVLLGAGMSQVHLWMPDFFPEPASYPYLDALTTIMSFVAMWLMARKHTESWIYWIVVDVIGIGLYFAKDVKFIALLYGVLLVLAVKGLRDWMKAGAQGRPDAMLSADTGIPMTGQRCADPGRKDLTKDG